MQAFDFSGIATIQLPEKWSKNVTLGNLRCGRIRRSQCSSLQFKFQFRLVDGWSKEHRHRAKTVTSQTACDGPHFLNIIRLQLQKRRQFLNPDIEFSTAHLKRILTSGDTNQNNLFHRGAIVVRLNVCFCETLKPVGVGWNQPATVAYIGIPHMPIHSLQTLADVFSQ